MPTRKVPTIGKRTQKISNDWKKRYEGAARSLIASACLLLAPRPARAQDYALLHSFGDDDDGAYPYGSLVASGPTLFGMTSAGGNGFGTIFRINTDGAGYTNIYAFPFADGSAPFGSLLLNNTTLYGMTSQGGANSNGTVFSVGTDGNEFAVLHDFTGGIDGANPYGSLTLSGTNLYGMTLQGGTNGVGTVFRMNQAGGGFTVLHTFAGGADGAFPYGSLTLVSTNLVGMTSQGGTNDLGVIFRMAPDGSGFTNLHTFAGGTDGANPYGSLTVAGTNLVGATSQGGTGGEGTLFRLNVAGTGYTTMHAFTSGGGTRPYGSLALIGARLYGLTLLGGAGGGVLFGINPDGTGFTNVHAFTGQPTDGAQPSYGSAPTLSGHTLYGLTSLGGATNSGALFGSALEDYQLAVRAIVSPTNSSGGAGIAWSSVPTWSYTVRWSTNGLGDFAVLQSNLVAATTTTLFQDTVTNAATRRFYRVELER